MLYIAKKFEVLLIATSKQSLCPNHTKEHSIADMLQTERRVTSADDKTPRTVTGMGNDSTDLQWDVDANEPYFLRPDLHAGVECSRECAASKLPLALYRALCAVRADQLPLGFADLILDMLVTEMANLKERLFRTSTATPSGRSFSSLRASKLTGRIGCWTDGRAANTSMFPIWTSSTAVGPAEACVCLLRIPRALHCRTRPSVGVRIARDIWDPSRAPSRPTIQEKKMFEEHGTTVMTSPYPLRDMAPNGIVAIHCMLATVPREHDLVAPERDSENRFDKHSFRTLPMPGDTEWFLRNDYIAESRILALHIMLNALPPDFPLLLRSEVSQMFLDEVRCYWLDLRDHRREQKFERFLKLHGIPQDLIAGINYAPDLTLERISSSASARVS